MPKLADNPASERAKEQLELDKKVVERSRAEYAERTAKGQPTPTQEENDLSAHGAHILEHDDDGSGPDPHNKRPDEKKQLEAGQQSKPQTYQTRQTTAKPE